MSKEPLKISLKQISNESLLNTYYSYRRELEHYQTLIDTQKMDKDTLEYYKDKVSTDKHYLDQINLEILSRMSGMEID